VFFNKEIYLTNLSRQLFYFQNCVTTLTKNGISVRKNKLEISDRLAGHLKTIQQARCYLQGMSKHTYRLVLTPNFSESAGTHMKHIINHYFALRDGVVTGKINYNARHFDPMVEMSLDYALKKLQEIEHILTGICQLTPYIPVQVLSETSKGDYIQISLSHSTLGRELDFVSSYSKHNLELLDVMKSLASV
jgi:hypothetical protein